MRFEVGILSLLPLTASIGIAKDYFHGDPGTFREPPDLLFAAIAGVIGLSMLGWALGFRPLRRRTVQDRRLFESSNAYFRRMATQATPTTGGIPDYYLSSVTMLRTAFPQGLQIDTRDYTAICVFFSEEGYSPRSISHVLDFAFGLGYVDVLNRMGFIQDEETRNSELERIRDVLRPHGLADWQSESQSM